MRAPKSQERGALWNLVEVRNDAIICAKKVRRNEGFRLIDLKGGEKFIRNWIWYCIKIGRGFLTKYLAHETIIFFTKTVQEEAPQQQYPEWDPVVSSKPYLKLRSIQTIFAEIFLSFPTRYCI
jgi:hypothetical protein